MHLILLAVDRFVCFLLSAWDLVCGRSTVFCSACTNMSLTRSALRTFAFAYYSYTSCRLSIRLLAETVILVPFVYLWSTTWLFLVVYSSLFPVSQQACVHFVFLSFPFLAPLDVVYLNEETWSLDQEDQRTPVICLGCVHPLVDALC